MNELTTVQDPGSAKDLLAADPAVSTSLVVPRWVDEWTNGVGQLKDPLGIANRRRVSINLQQDVQILGAQVLSHEQSLSGEVYHKVKSLIEQYLQGISNLGIIHHFDFHTGEDLTDETGVHFSVFFTDTSMDWCKVHVEFAEAVEEQTNPPVPGAAVQSNPASEPQVGTAPGANHGPSL